MTRTSKATETKTGRKPAGMDAMEQLIPLEDDCMFTAVMRNRDACMGFLEALFGGRKVRDVEYVNPREHQVQKHLVFNPSEKSIRMDVYFEDSDAVYDIELQRTDEGDLPRRARMYSSYMDTGILGKGMDYRRLRDSYVVFVCKFDPFDRGEKLYHFETVDRRYADLKTKDGRHIMFLNTKGTVGELEPDMEALFSYINGGEGSIGMETGSRYVDRLDGYVRSLNMDETWRMEHMKYELSLEQRFRDGEEKGVAEEKRRMVKSFKEQGFPVEAIAKASSLSVEEVQRIN